MGELIVIYKTCTGIRGYLGICIDNNQLNMRKFVYEYRSMISVGRPLVKSENEV